jgi:hypothetical protein
MSAAENQSSMSTLRLLEMRSRLMPLKAQIGDCVELLQSPEIAVEDLLRGVGQIDYHDAARVDVTLVSTPDDHREGFFYPCRELSVLGDGCSFTCLATSVQFIEEGLDDPDAKPTGLRPIDYAGVTCESQPLPVFGFVQSAGSESAYPLLLRALSTLLELVRPGRLAALENDVYRGLLGPAPFFDLALVLWDDDREDDPRRSLCELTRDLAEVLKQALVSEKQFPPVLRDVVCLRMNPKRFQGRMRFVWRV